jgi:acyl carrier protein
MTSNDTSLTNDQTADEAAIARLVVDTLGLETAPGAIAPEAPLYQDGLGLDSIDILEIALVVSKNFGFQLRADDAENIKIFSSLRSLNQHIQNCRTK